MDPLAGLVGGRHATQPSAFRRTPTAAAARPGGTGNLIFAETLIAHFVDPISRSDTHKAEDLAAINRPSVCPKFASPAPGGSSYNSAGHLLAWAQQA